MSEQMMTQAKSQAMQVKTVAGGVLQRQCACGQHMRGGECVECRKKHQGASQRSAANSASTNGVPPLVHEVLSSSGRPLDAGTRAFMEPRFGYDFSQVRVHTDARAAESARSVNALAYTVGKNVVFGGGQYMPETMIGKRLMAHELTHTIQQANAATLNRQVIAADSSQSNLEAEADRSSEDKKNDQPAINKFASADLYIMRQATGSGSSGCTPAQLSTIRSAQRGGFTRTQRAYERVAGIGPPGPPGRPDPAQEWQEQARSVARTIFHDDLNMDQVADIVGTMRARLATPDLEVVCSASNDPDCGTRSGYIRGFRPPVHLCPAFFKSTSEDQIRTMIHESAHLARIGEAIGESYCAVYDCQSSCGGFNVADSWSHFVHCLSGQAPDVPTTIQAGHPIKGGHP